MHVRPKQTPYKICESKEEATRFMHDQARRLHRRKLTTRYGVKIKPSQRGYHAGTWVVVLVDRQPFSGPPGR